MDKISKTFFITALGFAVVISAPTATGQEDRPTLSFEQEADRSIWRGVFDIGIPWSENYWAFWNGDGDPIDMQLADSPDAIRAGQWETVTRTGEGLRYEPIGNDGVAGLVAYGMMKDPTDPTKRWIKIVADGDFKWFLLPRTFRPDYVGFSLPPYGVGSLITHTVDLAERPGGPTASFRLAPDEIETYRDGYGFAEISTLETMTIEAPEKEKYWDTGLEPEASSPKNIWVKIRVYRDFTQYGEMSSWNEDTVVLAEGWMRLYGPDGQYQINYSPKGC